MEPIFSLLIIAILAVCCFWLPEKINPPEKKPQKTSEHELGEAFMKLAKYLLDAKNAGNAEKK